MSAIAGIIRARSAIVNQRELANMAERLRIHGPDASGTWHSDACGLASNLRKVTPEDTYERQPLKRDDVILVGDLRLNNRAELISKLGLRAPSHTLLPDSELVLSAYQKWQRDCVEHLLGAFVFAVWDETEQSLFLARDQTGEKTVFYHQSPDFFAFASMPKGLFALPWIRRELNEEKLAEFLTLNHSNHQTSFYKDVHRLPPGHCLTLRNGSLSLRKYWELDLQQRIVLKTDDAYVEQGREILETCIRDALRSASPVGAMMSGGLDSSTVACIAARLLGNSTLQTFTEVPDQSLALSPPNPKRYCDESRFIREICEMHPNIVSQFVQSTVPDLFQNFERRSGILESPHRNPFNQIWLEDISETASKNGINVLLTGQSGNMSFSYDGLWNFPNLFKTIQWRKLARALRDTSRTQGISPWRLARSKVLMPLCPPPVWELAMNWRNKRRPAWDSYSAINPDFIHEHGIAKKFGGSSFRVSADGRKARAEAAIGYDYFGETLQGFGSMFGIELRDPLGDIRLLQWSLAIPETQYLRNGQPRWLATRLGRGLLPTSVLNNNKRGLQAAGWAYSLEKQLPMIQQELEHAKNSPLAEHTLDLPALETLVRDWPGAAAAPMLTYRFKLCRSLVVAKFLRNLESD